MYIVVQIESLNTMRVKKVNEWKHLIYFSKPSSLDDRTISEILETSRKNNQKNKVTGALIWRSDLYFQFLEGPAEEIDKTFKRIESDSRHSEIRIIKEGILTRRLFASWAMREDPVHTWMWTRKEVKDGILHQIEANDALKTFERLSREVDQFNV